jgi:porin
MHDINSEMNALEYAGALFNSSFGTPIDYSQVGPSIYPLTTLGALVRIKGENLYWINGIYDGVPSDPNKTKGTHIRFDNGDGIFWGSEFGYIEGAADEEDYSKIAVGSWYHTKKFQDPSGKDRDSNSGFYAIAEQKLFSEQDDPSQGLGAFVQLGFADKDLNQVSSYQGFGLNYVGLFDGRNQDTTVLGVARANISSIARANDESLSSNETTLEIGHRFQITDYFAVNPDLQYVVNTGASKELDNALVWNLRTEIRF